MEISKTDAYRRLKSTGVINFKDKRFFQICKQLDPTARTVNEQLFKKLENYGRLNARAGGRQVCRNTAEKRAVLRRIAEFDAASLTGSEVMDLCLVYGVATEQTLKRYGLRRFNVKTGEICRYTKAEARDLVLGLGNNKKGNL